MAFKSFFKKIGIFIPILAVFLMSQNTFAESTFISQYGIYGSNMNLNQYPQCLPYRFEQGFSANQKFIRCAITAFLVETGSVTINGNNIVVTAKVNLVVEGISDQDWRYLSEMKILGLSIAVDGGSVQAITPTASSYQYYNTHWRGSTPGNNYETNNATLTVIFNATGTLPQSLVGKTGKIRALFGKSANYDGTSQSDAIFYGGQHNFYFQTTDSAPIVNFANSSTDASNQAVVDQLSIMTQQNTVINNNIQNISNQISEQNQKENAAIDNIDGQSSSDIPNSEDQQTTNLIGVINNFISSIGNINATNCQVTLNFPSYAGGTRIVDICQGKEKAPTIITIGSSMLLIGVFIPLAWLLLRMIYSEIRSWTNG